MSKTFRVKGFVDVRIYVDTDINASSATSGEDVANLVQMQITSHIGKSETLHHSFMIDGLEK